MIDRKDIFMSGFKSKIGYSFTYKDLNEFETIIDFYEQQVQKQKEVIDKLKRYINGCLELTPNEDRNVTDNILDNEFKYLLKILKEVSK